MQYLITFLEGLISFLSPCMLPMLPVYLSYFAGNADKKHRVLLRAGCFVLGFTLVFSLMGLFAGTLSTLLMRHQTGRDFSFTPAQAAGVTVCRVSVHTLTAKAR